MTLHALFYAVLMLASLSSTTGCAGRRPPPAQLLMLTPLTSASMDNPAPSVRMPGRAPAPVPALVIGPIDLPAYTERSQVLRLHEQSELQAAVTARWAEPLEENFSRVLVENLSRLLGTGQVTSLGGVQARSALQVTVEVTEFVATDTGQATLTAYWRVLGESGRALLASNKTRYQEAATGADYPALVAAMSRTVAALSRDIARAVRGLADGRQ